MNRFRRSGPDVLLTRPDTKRMKLIVGDGNCLFRSFSYIITGRETEHMAIRCAILRHMVDIAHLLLGPHITYDSVDEYVQAKSMNKDGAWGSVVEMMTLAHLLQTPVYSYDVQSQTWSRYSPSTLDRSAQPVDDTQMGMYINYKHKHFEVVSAVLPP